MNYDPLSHGFQSRCLTAGQLWGFFFLVTCQGMLHHLGLSWKQMWYFNVAFCFFAFIQDLYSQFICFSLNPKYLIFFLFEMELDP